MEIIRKIKSWFKKDFSQIIIDITMAKKIVMVNGKEYAAILLENHWWSRYIKVVYLMEQKSFYNELGILIRVRLCEMNGVQVMPFDISKRSVAFISDLSHQYSGMYMELIDVENKKIEDFYNNICLGQLGNINCINKQIKEPTHIFEQEYLM